MSGISGSTWTPSRAACGRRRRATRCAAGAVVYVGDHVSDVAGARAAGALSLAVTTGPITRSELLDAGADAVMDTLSDFPEWFAEFAERNCQSERRSLLGRHASGTTADGIPVAAQ